MISPALAHFSIWIIVAISIGLMLIRPRNIPEVYCIGAGALLLLILRLVPIRVAGQAIAKAVDVCFFLTGMMLLSELAREQGVFDWLSSIAVRGADGSCSKLFTLVYAVGMIVTIFMSNDATAVVLTPAILTAVRKAKVQPLPYLFVCAFIANAASFVLPISNPANLVVFHNDMPRLGQWIISLGVPSGFSIVTTYFALRWLFRRELNARVESKLPAESLSHSGKLVLGGLVYMVFVLLVASSFKKDLGLPTCLAALAVTIVVSIKARSNPVRLAREISWSTLLLVAGLFVMVEAVENIGAMQYTLRWLAWVQNLGSWAGTLIMGFAVGLANSLVNNLPLGLVAGATLQAANAKGLIASAVLIGVDLGPNLSITGSLATILWLIALRKQKIDADFWSFFRIGMVAMPVALLASLVGAIVMQILGAS